MMSNRLYKYRNKSVCEGDITYPWKYQAVVASSRELALRYIARKMNTSPDFVEFFYDVEGVEYNGSKANGFWVRVPGGR